MQIKVNPHTLEIIKSPVNEKEINITKCEFEFAPEITDEYVKEAYFTYNGTSYKQIIVNNECDIPYEVLDKKGQVELGVVAFLVEDEEEIKRYNPSPAYFETWIGSLKDNPENTEPITPTDKEQIESQIQSNTNEINNIKSNLYELVAGENIILTKLGNKIIISAIGVTPPVLEGQLITSDDKIFVTIDEANFIVKESD